MSQELVYTSVPTGLNPGSKGFCTVAITAGLGATWSEKLESLSGYRPIFPLGDPNSSRNPVNFSHWRINLGGKTRSVLSRVAFAGADYSQRSNKIAHHIVLDPSELSAAGPAWMMLQCGFMRTEWTETPQQFSAGPALPRGESNPRICAAWAGSMGDAGWAGALAESFAKDPAKPAYLIYAPGTNVLELFDESLSLLPPEQRWTLTFSTFFTDLPLNLTCAWRAVVAGTPAATAAMRLGARALVLDLTKPAEGAPPAGIYADAARTGTGPVIARDGPPRSTPKLASSFIEERNDPEDTKAEFKQEDEEATALANTAGGWKRKRLAPAAASSAFVEEPSELADLEQREPFRYLPPQVLVEVGMRGWKVACIAVLCTVLGGLAGFGVSNWFRSPSHFSQAQAPTTAPATQTAADDSLRQEWQSSKAENTLLKQELAAIRAKNDAQAQAAKPATQNVQAQAEAANQATQKAQATIAATIAGAAAPDTKPAQTPPAPGTFANPGGEDDIQLLAPSPNPSAESFKEFLLPSEVQKSTRIAILWPNNDPGASFSTRAGARALKLTATDDNTGISISGDTTTLGMGSPIRVDVMILKINGAKNFEFQYADNKDNSPAIRSAAWWALSNSVFEFIYAGKTHRFRVRPDPDPAAPFYIDQGEAFDVPRSDDHDPTSDKISDDYDLNDARITGLPLAVVPQKNPLQKEIAQQYSFPGEKSKKVFVVTLRHPENSGRFQLSIERPDLAEMEKQCSDDKANADRANPGSLGGRYAAAKDEKTQNDLKGKLDSLRQAIEIEKKVLTDYDADYRALQNLTYTLRLPNGVPIMSIKIKG
jgi:hypothetical protein